LRVVQIAGGVFGLFLAWKTYRAFRAFQSVQVEPENVARKSLFQAVLMNFLSPGPYLFWSLLAGPTLLRGWSEAPPHGLAFLLGFYSALIGGTATLIVLFGAARRLGPQVNRAMLGFSALALAGFGLYQLWMGAG
jgi:threonine/homoserine/homoserine lactone efflux protein